MSIVAFFPQPLLQTFEFYCYFLKSHHLALLRYIQFLFLPHLPDKMVFLDEIAKNAPCIAPSIVL